MADVPRLTYMRAIIDEAMRLYRPAYILFRHVKEDDVMCGHRIHRGVVVMTPMIFHRHPSFSEQPDAFAPDWWRRRIAGRASRSCRSASELASASETILRA